MVPSWHTKMIHVRFPGNLYARYGATISMVPMMAPAGMVRSKLLSWENPKSLMMMGMKELHTPTISRVVLGAPPEQRQLT